jgi:carboxymethylenebutenolidase
MNIQTRNVSVPRNNTKEVMESYIALPEGKGPFPGLLIIHEIFGLTENIRDITRRFAEEGYFALAVDLFSNRNRTLCMMQTFYGLMFRPLDNPMLTDLQASMSFLRQQPEVDTTRTGTVGFCMGGSYALELAVTEKGMKAASIFYGMNPKPLEAVARSCPIIGSYPDKDFTAQAGRALDAALNRYEIAHDIKIYEGTQHSFFNDTRPSFNPEGSKDAWDRMLAFFNEYLVKSVK